MSPSQENGGNEQFANWHPDEEKTMRFGTKPEAHEIDLDNSTENVVPAIGKSQELQRRYEKEGRKFGESTPEVLADFSPADREKIVDQAMADVSKIKEIGSEAMRAELIDKRIAEIAATYEKADSDDEVETPFKTNAA